MEKFRANCQLLQTYTANVKYSDITLISEYKVWVTEQPW